MKLLYLIHCFFLPNINGQLVYVQYAMLAVPTNNRGRVFLPSFFAPTSPPAAPRDATRAYEGESAEGRW
jgi:hypothetical protein